MLTPTTVKVSRPLGTFTEIVTVPLPAAVAEIGKENTVALLTLAFAATPVQGTLNAEGVPTVAPVPVNVAVISVPPGIGLPRASRTHTVSVPFAPRPVAVRANGA